jgi:tetratricopeptide (TPR) repeat protein
MPVNSNATKKLSRASQRDLDTRIEFMEGLVRRDPDYADALQLLGDHYTQRGRYADGLKVDEHLSRLEPRDPLVFYNLACSYSLTGQFDLAASALQKAIQLGYRDFKWLAKDPDLRELRQQPIYRDIQNKIRRMKVEVR